MLDDHRGDMNRTEIPSAMDSEQMGVSRNNMRRPPTKQSTVKFGEVNQVYDIDKNGKHILSEETSLRKKPLMRKSKSMAPQGPSAKDLGPWTTSVGSIKFGNG